MRKLETEILKKCVELQQKIINGVGDLPEEYYKGKIDAYQEIGEMIEKYIDSLAVEEILNGTIETR